MADLILSIHFVHPHMNTPLTRSMAETTGDGSGWGVDQEAHQLCSRRIPWLTIMWEGVERGQVSPSEPQARPKVTFFRQKQQFPPQGVTCEFFP